ncbi:putative Tic20 family protein [Paraburkholderia sp. EB58]|jgi:uncharacterized Tic20 family protein|uniref:hypothetical protein n=1 Tax=Paraburkholderia sp. EB58 TaxID=3035125 RepID=UPI003D1A45F2
MSFFNKVGKSFYRKLVSITLAMALISVVLVIGACLLAITSTSQRPLAAYVLDIGFLCMLSPLVAVICAIVRGSFSGVREVFNRRFAFNGPRF